MSIVSSVQLAQDQVPTRVFLSYSRRDETFVRRLAEGLEARGYAVDFDQSDKDPASVEFGISAQDRWWLRLKEMIAAADVMVFTISPDSVASRVCDDEIAYAGGLGKRIIPILRQRIDFDRAPERLRALNVKLSFERDDDEVFARAIERLCAELRHDIDWHRRAARMARLAQQWDADGRPEGQLLRAGAIAEADAWAARRPNGAPPPGALLLDFLSASRDKEEQDRIRLQSSELNARLRASDALFERALVHLERAEHHSACERLLEAASIASPTAMPDGFAQSLKHEGWARKAWTAAACIASNLPQRIAKYEHLGGFGRAEYVWFDGGRHLLVADEHRLDVLHLDEGRVMPSWSRELPSRPVTVAGAGAAPRLCFMTEDGALQAIDLQTGTERQSIFTIRHDVDDRAATLGISDTGDAIVLARITPDETQVRADILVWERVSAGPELSVTMGGGYEAKPRWAGFTADAMQFGVLCGDGLRSFDRQGNEVAHLAGQGRDRSGVAADLSAFATPQYDLVQLFRRDRDPRRREKEERSTEPLVLQGAASVVGEVSFLRQDDVVLARDLRGRVLEWRPRPEVQRGSTTLGAQITQSFGTSNRLEPSNRLEGLPRADAVVTHPSAPQDLLVLARTGAEHWRLADPTKPMETIASLGASARVVADAASGFVAAATERGVWMRPIDRHGEPGITIASAGVVWDVAIGGPHLAATWPDGSVRIWRLHDGKELQQLAVEAPPLSLLFSPDGTRLYVGLSNGVLWEWSQSDDMSRVAALGVGPIVRLRMSADGRVGTAAGRSPDDDFDRMHGGVAVWSPSERRLLWTTEHSVVRPHDVDISPDGAVLFVADTREAIAMAPETGEVLSRMRPPQADASKPEHVTAICAGPDGRTVFLGLWDGSIVHVDILSKRVLSAVKSHTKYVSSIACDLHRGLLLSVSPVPHADHLAVWRAWDPEFFRENVARGERMAEVRRAFEILHGTSAGAENASATEPPLNIAMAAAADPVEKARAMRDFDEMRAADLLAQAALAGRSRSSLPTSDGWPDKFCSPAMRRADCRSWKTRRSLVLPRPIC